MHSCCSRGDTSTLAATAIALPTATHRSWIRRVGALIKWAVPITTLALIPKCPGCIAGYVILFTGFGLSYSTAAAMRRTLIALCIVALAYLLLRTARRVITALG